MSNLETRTATAISRINEVFKKNPIVITGHSGGKDSVVINDLVNKSGNRKYATVHNTKPLLGTSGDPVLALTEQHPLTLEFLYVNVSPNEIITYMKSTLMPQWLEDHGVTCQIDGSRVSEYLRPGKSSEFIHHGVKVSREFLPAYIENGIFNINMSYPIYDWTDDEVFEYIIANNLDLSKEYTVNGELAAYHASLAK